MEDPALRGDHADVEKDVVYAVWDEVGGMLVREFVVPIIPGDRRRNRRIDAVFATDGHRDELPERAPLSLRGRDVVVCQAKSGELDLGVLGQTLFGAELIEREHAPRSLRLIAAAVKPNPLIERLLESYRPLGRRIEHRTYPHLEPGESSGAYAPPPLRQELISELHSEVGGFLITVGQRRVSSDFRNVRAVSTDESLRHADPDAVILLARRWGQAVAKTAVEVTAEEPVMLVYACTDLYMTAMGRAVFGGEIARRLLGLADVTSALLYRIDNAALRELMERLPHVALPRDVG